MATKSVQSQIPFGTIPVPEVLTQFRLLAEGSPAGLFLVDREGRCTYVNPHAAAILDMLLPTACADSWPRLFGLESAASVMASWRAVASRHYSGTFRLRSAHAAGRWVEVRTSPILEGGSVVAHSGVIEDVSDRWTSVRRLTARDVITHVLASADSIDAARSAILSGIGEVLGWSVGVFWEADKQQKVLRAASIWHGSAADLSEFEAATRNLCIPSGIGLPGRVWSNSQPAWIADVTQDPNFPRSRAAAEDGLHGGLAFPITADGDLLAVVEFFSSAAWEPDPDLLHVVGVLGSQIGQFISRKRREAQLRQSEERFWQVAQNVGEVLWIAEPSAGHLVYISPAFEAIWGAHREQFLRDPKAFFSTVHAEDRPRAMAFRERAFRGVRTEEEYRIVRPDGTIAWIRDLAFPVRSAEGGLEHIVGLAVDISERIDRERQHAQQAKLEAIGTLAAGLAHDLNNLLTGVLGNASLAADLLPENHPARVLMRDLTTAGERAAYIVAQMLAYAGKGRFFQERVEMSGLVRQFVEKLAALPANIDLRLELTEALPQLEGDRKQLLHLIGNLYLNAVEAMADTPGTITIRTYESCDQEAAGEGDPEMPAGKRICLQIEDTGGGIAESIRSRIFDPFFTTKFIGRGLGLSAAQGIMRAHNGAIRVSSEPGSGARFTCIFPVLPGE